MRRNEIFPNPKAYAKWQHAFNTVSHNIPCHNRTVCPQTIATMILHANNYVDGVGWVSKASDYFSQEFVRNQDRNLRQALAEQAKWEDWGDDVHAVLDEMQNVIWQVTDEEEQKRKRAYSDMLEIERLSQFSK